MAMQVSTRLAGKVTFVGSNSRIKVGATAEIHESGKDVYLCTSKAVHTPITDGTYLEQTKRSSLHLQPVLYCYHSPQC